MLVDSAAFVSSSPQKIKNILHNVHNRNFVGKKTSTELL